MSDPLPPNLPPDATRALSAAPSARAEMAASVAGESGSALSAARSTICKADIARDDLSGLFFGPYALGLKLGGGGMGKIFAARHIHLERDFAIKFITSAAAHSAEARSRFDQEVKALGKLQHPPIVSAVDAGCIEGIPYLATERIFGEDLSKLIARRGPLPIADACELVRQAALGLAHSHSCGILHRDLKPSNLILDKLGVFKLLDFGLVCGTASDHGLTGDGAFLGTLDFLSPEQAHDSRQVGPASDFYSLGCTLLYLVSGRAPFEAASYSTPASKIKGHLLDTPQWLLSPPGDFPSGLLNLMHHLLAKQPQDRFASASEIAKALEFWCAGHQVASLLDTVHAAAPSAQVPTPRLASPAPLLIGIAASAAIALPLGAFAAWHIFSGSSPQADSRAIVAAKETPPATEPAKATVTTQATAAPLAEPAPPSATKHSVPAVVTNEPQQTANASAVEFEFPTKQKKGELSPFATEVNEPAWNLPYSGK